MPFVLLNMNRLLAGSACLLVELVPAAENSRIFGGMPPDVYVAKNGGYRYLPWILQRDLEFLISDPRVIFIAGTEPVTWKDLADWTEKNSNN